ncbi:MAG: type 4a pilus biogenesis protein PilO [candidate division Zixibacteria bacterium]|nr:type 4a pilus biogenesis protein PilO [candidate division Zixibacteria bacterium]MBU1470761.1 type 4a pilus biogenesis protein PilO [candidate division Zixibacteria bacterium]MBU2625283.1 type 4a pilus biogenesis protein PilO [candidate division Zixibacteria bacterium]
MDLKDPKTQKIALVIMGFFLVTYFWYSRVYSTNDEQLAMKRGQYESIMTDLKAVEMKAKSLDGLRTEYDDLKERYQAIELLLPDERQVPKFLVQLHSAAALTQSRLLELSPLTIEDAPYYSVSDYELKFTGTYHELGEFLASVANFPFITNVSHVEIDGIPETSLEQSRDKRAMHDTRSLEAKLVLSTYFVRPEDKLSGINQ